jgi:quercetin dioxygenase-like cupin family protein
MPADAVDPPTPLWPREAEPWHISPDYKFTGRTEVRHVGKALDIDTMQINTLYFEEGVRSRPHSHDADQVLFFVEGTGVVAVGGSGDQIVEAGQFVRLPANVVHMHGAAPGHTATHISLMPAVHVNDFEPEVPPGWERYEDDVSGAS